MNFNPGIAIVALDDLVWNQVLVLGNHRVIKTATDQALDRKNGTFRIGDGLTLCRLADKTFVTVGECNDRRGCTRTFGIFDDLRAFAVHDGYAGVGRSQIDTNNFSHISLHSANRQDLYRAFRGRFLSVSQCSFHDARPDTDPGYPTHINALCEAYIRNTVFHCKSQEPDKDRFLARYSLQVQRTVSLMPVLPAR